MAIYNGKKVLAVVRTEQVEVDYYVGVATLESEGALNFAIPSNIEVNGNSYPIIEDTKTSIVEIEGNSGLVVNQLLDITLSYELIENGITTTLDSVNKTIHYVGTATATGGHDFIISVFNKNNLVVGHKYAMLFNKVGNSGTSFFYVQGLAPSNQLIDDLIMTGEDTSQYGRITINEGETIDFTIKPQIIDLTKMFSAGNEPTTIDEFNKRVGNIDISTYNEGTIVFTNVAKVNSYKKYASVDLGTLDWTYESGKFYTLGLINTILSNDFIKEKGNIFCLKYENTSYNDLYDGQEGISLYQNVIYIRDNNYTDATTFKQSLQGVILEYEPSDPTNADFLGSVLINQELKGIGTALEKIAFIEHENNNFEAEKTNLIGSVDMGTLNWVKSGDYWRYSEGLSNAKAPTTNNDVANMLCSNFKTTSYNGLTISNKEIAMNTSKQLIIYDTSITQASDIKGVLYYELASPIIAGGYITFDEIAVDFEKGGTIEVESENNANTTMAFAVRRFKTGV